MFQKLPFLTSVKQKQYLKGINPQMTSQIVEKKLKKNFQESMALLNMALKRV